MNKDNSKSADLCDLKDKVEKLELLLKENILDKKEQAVVKDEIVMLRKLILNLDRQFLHAQVLGFSHPLSKENFKLFSTSHCR